MFHSSFTTILPCLAANNATSLVIRIYAYNKSGNSLTSGGKKIIKLTQNMALPTQK